MTIMEAISNIRSNAQHALATWMIGAGFRMLEPEVREKVFELIRIGVRKDIL